MIDNIQRYLRKLNNVYDSHTKLYLKNEHDVAENILFGGVEMRALVSVRGKILAWRIGKNHTVKKLTSFEQMGYDVTSILNVRFNSIRICFHH